MARTRDRDDDDRGRSKRSGGSSYEQNLAENVRKRGEQSGGAFDNFLKDGVSRYTPPRGDNCVRFLPPQWEDAEHYGLDVWVHYSIGADKGTYLCLKKMKGKDCPICNAAAEMKAEGGKEAEAGKKISAKQRVLTYLIDRNERRPELKVWAMPWTVDKEIGLASNNKKSGEVLNIVNKSEGYDVFFRLEGQKLNTKYSGVSIDRDSSPLADDKRDAADWIAETKEKPLPSLLKYYDADYLQKVVDGHSSASTDDDDEDDDDRGSRKRSSKRSSRDDDDDEAPRRKRRDSDDDDDEDEGPRNKRSKRRPADDDDEDEAPRKRRRDADEDDEDEPRSKRKRPADDDDDDDEPAPRKKRSRDSDDDDDEPAPRKRRPAADDDDDEDDAPRSKRKRSRDEDEADPADDDDDADDRPRTKRKRPADDDDEEDDEPRSRRSRR